jgi:hypothetical protein
MVKYYPTIKLNQPSIRNVWKGLLLDVIFIRLQDILCSKTSKLNNIFYDIQAAGGIHAYLNFDGIIILSLIMRDKLISMFDENRYAEVIKAIKPDCITTVDGETYEGEEVKSLDELKRMVMQTSKLLKLCPEVVPIGQIKGCTEKQILFHLDMLKALGITKFIFHVGDFFRNGNKDAIARAKKYITAIHKQTDSLILYGLGSQKRIYEFSFVNGYASLSYFVKARHGKKLFGTNELSGYHYNYDLVRHNLEQIMLNIKHINEQKKLIEGGKCIWEEALEQKDQVTQEINIPVIAA